jgi:hypothetical protein
MAIIIATLPAAAQRESLLLPLIYAVFIVIDSTLVSLLFRRMAARDAHNA